MYSPPASGSAAPSRVRERAAQRDHRARHPGRDKSERRNRHAAAPKRRQGPSSSIEPDESSRPKRHQHGYGGGQEHIPGLADITAALPAEQRRPWLVLRWKMTSSKRGGR